MVWMTLSVMKIIWCSVLILLVWLNCWLWRVHFHRTTCTNWKDGMNEPTLSHGQQLSECKFRWHIKITKPIIFLKASVHTCSCAQPSWNGGPRSDIAEQFRSKAIKNKSVPVILITSYKGFETMHVTIYKPHAKQQSNCSLVCSLRLCLDMNL